MEKSPWKSVYIDVNYGRTNYRSFEESIFVDHSLWLNFLNGADISEVLQQQNGNQYKSVLHIYIVVKTKLQEYQDDPWALIYVDKQASNIYLIDPHFIDNSFAAVDEILSSYKDSITRFMNSYMMQLEQSSHTFEISLYQMAYPNCIFLEPLRNHTDSGIYVALALYFMVLRMPVFFFSHTVRQKRIQLGYWCLIGELPF